MPELFKKLGLCLRLVNYMTTDLMVAFIRRKYATKFLTPPAVLEGQAQKNIVIIGASFAGYSAAQALKGSLPPNYRLIVIEPHSHFHFTWVFPRFCVIEGHEEKAFIPYPLQASSSEDKKGNLRWMKGRATELTKNTVTVRLAAEGGGEEKTEVVDYEYLLIATGSVSNKQSIKDTGGLPSRVIDDDRAEGAQRMKDMQIRIRDSKRLVIVGGGSAGVELATDTATKYNIKDNVDRKIVLVHSRNALMNRFGPRLQETALEALVKQGVEVILEDRVVGEVEDGMVKLQSGNILECDFLVNCAGQKPASSLLTTLAPHCLTSSGHIKVRPTLQIDDDELSHIYSCGDVAETSIKAPNGRSAFIQAGVVVDNIIACAWGKQGEATYRFSPHWALSHIKLTLGLENSILHLGDDDDDTEILFSKKDTPTLAVHMAWKGLGAKPFEGISSVVVEK